MDRKVAKESLLLRDWLDRAADIDGRGEDVTISRDLAAWRVALAGAFAEAQASLPQ